VFGKKKIGKKVEQEKWERKESRMERNRKP
jgi:hypothetical protein